MKTTPHLLLHCPGCGALRPIVAVGESQQCTDCGYAIPTVGADSPYMQAMLRHIQTTSWMYQMLQRIEDRLYKIFGLILWLGFFWLLSMLISGCVELSRMK